MESDLEQQQQAPQVNSSGGLTRYRSAPSSYFNNIIDKEFYEHVFNRPSSPETERVFSRFMNSLGSEVEEDSSLKVKEEEIINNNEHEHVVLQQHQQQSNIINNISNENYNSVPTHQQQHPHGTFYQKPPLPNAGNQNQNHSSNLIRHSSSPAGLFSQINIENGYVVGMRGMGEAKFSNARSLKNQSNYSSGLMSSISEIGEKSNRENNLDSEAFAESHGNDFITDYQVGPWDDLSVNVSGLKRFVDHDSKPFSGLNAAATQNESGGQPHSPLVHQLSMPNTSAEMAAMEKFLHFSDAVPCKIRAKRGCATHPRSIAERVRRTKISERMRKLQDLVPNMDKQTNTSDMLDLAVDYIKDLQKEVQTLSDCRAKCTCSHKQQQ